MSRIAAAFREAAATDRLALFPYLTAGFPDRASCPELIAAILRGGADGLEIGIPFSDPLADGATLQRANERALAGGATVDTALDLARMARQVSSTVPIVFMSYYNPILARGEKAFCRDAAEAGADGVIVPDLPPEECTSLRDACIEAGLDYVLMLGPTSTPRRLAHVAELARGFIYCVSLVGVTGARSELSPELPPFLGRVRAVTTVPRLVGFGISSPAHVRAIHGLAEGVIVASALADLIDSTPAPQRANALCARVADLKAATTAKSAVN